MYATIAMQLVETYRHELWAQAAAERLARTARRTGAVPVATRPSSWSTLRILVAARLRRAAHRAQPSGWSGH
jgi:hypothetical protein